MSRWKGKSSILNTRYGFVIKKDANDGKYVDMSVSEKTNQGGLGDQADESDPKMFSTRMSNCPVKYFKKFLSVLNPNQTVFFQNPKRNFTSSDKIWFENSPIGVNKLGDMMKEMLLTASLSKVYTNHCVRSTNISALDEAGNYTDSSNYADFRPQKRE